MIHSSTMAAQNTAEKLSPSYSFWNMNIWMATFQEVALVFGCSICNYTSKQGSVKDTGRINGIAICAESVTTSNSSVMLSHFHWCFALATSLTETGKIILHAYFPIFCPCITYPSTRQKKYSVAPLTISKHSLLKRNLVASPPEQHSNIVLCFLFTNNWKIICPGYTERQTIY